MRAATSVPRDGVLLARRCSLGARVIQAIVFDLDNCLAAADEVGQALYEHAFTAMRRANRGRLSAAALAAAFADCWRSSLDVVAARHALPAEVTQAGWKAFRELTVKGPLHGYPDLNCVARLPGLHFLVTSGFRRLQESKVAALRIDGLFTEIHVDAIDEPQRRGKERIFRDIVQRHALHSARVLVVGDSPDAEIEAGNRVGMRTVQVLRPGVTRGANAHMYIESLHELEAHT